MTHITIITPIMHLSMIWAQPFCTYPSPFLLTTDPSMWDGLLVLSQLLSISIHHLLYTKHPHTSELNSQGMSSEWEWEGYYFWIVMKSKRLLHVGMLLLLILGFKVQTCVPVVISNGLRVAAARRYAKSSPTPQPPLHVHCMHIHIFNKVAVA